MSRKFKILTASLLDAAALFIGVYGIIFSIVTAYDINLSANTVLRVLLLSSLCLSLAFHIEKFRKTAYLSAAAVGAVLLFLNAQSVVNGFLKFIHLVTSKLSLFYASIPVTKDVSLSSVGIIRANTAFFSFFAALLAMLLALSIIKAGSVWLASFISVPTFFISLIFVKSVPDTLPVFAFIVFLLSAILTIQLRKGSSKRASYMLSLFVPATLVFVLTIAAIFPERTYSRAEIAEKMYRYFAERLPITLRDKNQNSESAYSESSVGQTSSADETASGSVSETPAYHRIDLNNASPSKTGETILKVNTDKQGKLLLRGFSLGEYTGSSWEQFNTNIQKELYFSYPLYPLAVSYDVKINITPLSLPTYLAMATNNAEKYHLSVSKTTQGGGIVHTPYFPVFTDFQNMEHSSDSLVFSINNDGKVKYDIFAYSYDNIADVLENISDSVRKSDEFREIAEMEKTYRDFVYKYYTRIDDKTRSFLEEYTKGQNFKQITDCGELVEAVSRFVKNSAEYNINTPPTPSGKDYLKYFLTESRQGYCMHFATEATLLFRMLGVPARYVTGYSLHIGSENVGKWVNATDKNAHAWTEVYFNGIGWIPVDVTPSAYQGQTGTSSGSDSAGVPSFSVDSGSEPSAPAGSESAGSPEEPQSAPDSPDAAQPPSTGSIPALIYPAVPAAGLLFIYFRRKRLIEKRRKLFEQKDTNKAVIAAYSYIEKLKAYGVSPDKTVYAAAQKAVFSRHTLSEDERKRVVGFAQEKAGELDASLGFFRRIIFRYIKGLY